MKNLLLLLVLSLFSVQSFAAGCPDGSEPVKSISADGTYFVFKCGNKKADEFEDNSGVLLADEAKEMFDDHVKQSELLKVPLPSHNRIIKDYERFLDYRNNRMANNWNFTEYLWNEDPDGQLLTREVCKRILVEYKVSTTPTLEELEFKRCADYYSTTATLNLEEGVKLYQELLLEIASSKEDYWVYKDSGVSNFNPRDYNLWGVSSTFLMFYATNYDAFDYTNEERQLVENYYKEKAMKERLDRDGNRSNTMLCPIDDPMSLTADNHKVNNCGSVRFRFAPAELALAIVMQDEELWAKGLWDLDYTLSMIEEEGFYVNHSGKGCRALGYTWDTSKLLSMNVEMLKLADFNLLDYKTRHGKTIAEAYEMLFKQYEDITISNHIAEKGIGAASCGYKPFKTHDEFLFQVFGSSADYTSKYAFFKDKAKFKEAYELGLVPMFEDFINWSIRFVSEKHPEWLADFDKLREIPVNEGTSAYFTVQSFELFNANIMTEKDSIWHEKKKQLSIDAEKEDKSCKVSPLNGEYIAKWFVYDKNTGVEILSLDDCKGEFISGEFAGASNFMPSKKLREDLTISYKTNGQITVKGDLDFREDKEYVWLVGDINEGIVYSKDPRHPFRIELINKAQRDANIKKEKDERKAKIAQKKIIRDQACKDNEFNNEYVAKWFFQGSGSQEPYFQGVENLILDKCEGKFEGVNDFQPSNDLRKLLQVNYEPNGSIVVSGELDLIEKGDARQTELKGNINTGEISGNWGFGDQIIVQLSKKPKASELFDGRYSFNLFRYAEDEADKIGNGFINISNGQITIDKKYRNLKTGETDLYDTFNGQVDKNGEVSGSVKLDIISSKERSESYNFKGLLSDKIWGESPVEDFFKVYLKLIHQPEKETTSCNTKSFDGEYVASWFAESTNDDVGWEFVGKENIIFDSCKGKFEATEDFQPNKWFKMSKAFRKNLNIYIMPNGTINISGDLDLDHSETQKININSKISDGEISGYFNSGWRLKVELDRK